MEVAGLRRSALPRSGTDSLTAIRIDATKGGKARLIYPPLPLIDRTRAYMREERAVVVRRAQTRRAGYIEPDAVFLTDAGLPMSPRRIGAMFSAAASAAAVPKSFHALRHTFATAMLRFLQRRAELEPDLNPLLALQVLLGHADLATTAIYLRVVATDMTLVEVSVDELYEALL
jgi:site-specific recombinase XerD